MSYLREAFSEQTDKGPFGSFARLATGFTTAFVLGWDTAYIMLAWRWNTHYLAAGQVTMSLLPDPMVLAAQAAFITMLYGANKFASR